MYLLDTDTIIYILKGNPVVENNLQRHYYDPIKISVITLMELYYGAYKSQKVTSNLAKIKTLQNSLEIIPLGQEIAEIFGIQKANLEKRGTSLDDFDLILGCSALAHNLTLVSNNSKHFKKIEGLKLTNWTEEPK
jgi:predicted nucleic acid-binding protein